MSYHQYTTFLLERFEQVFLNHVPIAKKNHMADALSILSTTITLGENEIPKVRECDQWVIPSYLDLQVDERHHTSV